MIIGLLLMFVMVLLAGTKLVSGASWSGYVFNESGFGLNEVNVTVVLASNDSFLNFTFTDTNGFFRIVIPGVPPPVSVKFISSKSGFLTDTSQELPPTILDSISPFNITLEEASPGNLSGRITDAGGEGIENANVSALQNNLTIDSVLTNSSGHYIISNLRDGTYTLRITATGYLTQDFINVVVLPGNTTVTDISPPLDTIPPIISNVSATLITSSETVIIWQTDESANSSVDYYVSGGSVLSSSSATLLDSHMVRLSSLSSSTLYFYNVSSCDFSGNCNTSVLYNFTTLSASTESVSSGEGGGGGGFGTWIYTYREDDRELSEKGFITKILGKRERVRVKIDSRIHHIGIVELNNVNITINVSSAPQQAILAIGEEKKFEITDDEYYDVLVKLNNISDNKANVTVSYLHEEILASESLIPEQLFDIKLDLENFIIQDISKLVAIATFENFGSEPTPVTLLFTILNKDGEEVHSEEHAIIVETEEVFKRRFADVDLDLPNGKYTFILTTLYHVTVVDEFRHEFEIIGKKKTIIILVWIVGGIFAVLVAISAISLFIKLRKNKFKKRKIRSKRR